MLDWIENHDVDWLLAWVIMDRVYSVEKVNIIISIMDIMLMVWFGVSDTKYENITSIPPM